MGANLKRIKTFGIENDILANKNKRIKKTVDTEAEVIWGDNPAKSLVVQKILNKDFHVANGDINASLRVLKQKCKKLENRILMHN